MTLFVPREDGSIVQVDRGKLKERTPLAVMPPSGTE